MREKGSKYFFAVLSLVVLITSCKDIIEVDKPRTSLIRPAVFETDATAMSAMNALYASLSSQSGDFSAITLLASLSADDLLIGSGPIELQFYENDIKPINSTVAANWQSYYNAIFRANSMIEGLQQSDHITSALKTQLIGEAKFFRAFYHFYLVNLFGDVPYITTTDYRVNGLVARMPEASVYEMIEADLLEAKSLLPQDYSHAQGERVRVNKWAAASLLARAYLYREDWLHAEEQATTVINEISLYHLADLDEVFLKNSVETIFQVIPPGTQKYTSEGGIFNRPVHGSANPVITNELFNAFEVNDGRKVEWVGIGTNPTTWYYPLKYKETVTDTLGPDEYSTVFRLAELFLIRAEARANQNMLIGPGSAASDLDIIRIRAGLPATTAVTQQDLLTAIEQERRVELFTEWGHRWFDLKRTGRATAVLSLVKLGWEDSDALYPIPFSELNLNPNMTQNPGY